MWLYGNDGGMWIIAIIAAIWASIASARVNSTFKKYSTLFNSRGMTGRMCAEALLRSAGIYDVRVESVSGNLTDHFDPKAKVIRLSESVYSSSSVAAIGVAAHEAGHAIQHNVGYFPIKIRQAIIPVCQIGSNLAMPLILLGLFISATGLCEIGLLLFSLSALFQLVTLPVEFNASRRALEYLENGMGLNMDEMKAARKVLRSAAMTYVAALAVALANLLRLVAVVNNSRRR
jgi:Zn-dependent membrane protease YugP